LNGAKLKSVHVETMGCTQVDVQAKTNCAESSSVLSTLSRSRHRSKSVSSVEDYDDNDDEDAHNEVVCKQNKDAQQCISPLYNNLLSKNHQGHPELITWQQFKNKAFKRDRCLLRKVAPPPLVLGEPKRGRGRPRRNLLYEKETGLKKIKIILESDIVVNILASEQLEKYVRPKIITLADENRVTRAMVSNREVTIANGVCYNKDEITNETPQTDLRQSDETLSGLFEKLPTKHQVLRRRGRPPRVLSSANQIVENGLEILIKDDGGVNFTSSINRIQASVQSEGNDGEHARLIQLALPLNSDGHNYAKYAAKNPESPNKHHLKDDPSEAPTPIDTVGGQPREHENTEVTTSEQPRKRGRPRLSEDRKKVAVLGVKQKLKYNFVEKAVTKCETPIAESQQRTEPESNEGAKNAAWTELGHHHRRGRPKRGEIRIKVSPKRLPGQRGRPRNSGKLTWKVF